MSRKRISYLGSGPGPLTGKTQLVSRSLTVVGLVDQDAVGTRENLLHIIAIKKRIPDLIIVPAHEMRSMAGLPTLPKACNGIVAGKPGTDSGA